MSFIFNYNLFSRPCYNSGVKRLDVRRELFTNLKTCNNMNRIEQINSGDRTFSLNELNEIIERQKNAISNFVGCDISKVYESITMDGKVLFNCRENGKRVIMLCKLSKHYWLEVLDTKIIEYK